jgi:hypothetical protein
MGTERYRWGARTPAMPPKGFCPNNETRGAPPLLRSLTAESVWRKLTPKPRAFGIDDLKRVLRGCRIRPERRYWLRAHGRRNRLEIRKETETRQQPDRDCTKCCPPGRLRSAHLLPFPAYELADALRLRCLSLRASAISLPRSQGAKRPQRMSHRNIIE